MVTLAAHARGIVYILLVARRLIDSRPLTTAAPRSSRPTSRRVVFHSFIVLDFLYADAFCIEVTFVSFEESHNFLPLFNIVLFSNFILNSSSVSLLSSCEYIDKLQVHYVVLGK